MSCSDISARCSAIIASCTSPVLSSMLVDGGVGLGAALLDALDEAARAIRRSSGRRPPPAPPSARRASASPATDRDVAPARRWPWLIFPSSSAFCDHVADQADGGEVGLIGARGAEHVDHLFGASTFGSDTKPSRVGVGMRRLVAAAERRLVLDDAGDLHADGAGLPERAVERCRPGRRRARRRGGGTAGRRGRASIRRWPCSTRRPRCACARRRARWRWR